MAKDTTTTSLLDFLSKHSVNLPEETVHIEQWGRDVTLRGFSSKDRDLFEEESLRRANAKAGNGAKRGAQIQADLSNFRARLVARHIVENGERVLATKQGEDLLGAQPASVLDKLFTVAQRLSGFTSEDIETLVGNSETTAAESSSSSSPELLAGPSLN
jgi:hypothetical protein